MNCKVCNSNELYDGYGWGDNKVCKECNSYYLVSSYNDLIFCGIDFGKSYITYDSTKKITICISINSLNHEEYVTDYDLDDYKNPIDMYNLLKAYYDNLIFYKGKHV